MQPQLHPLHGYIDGLIPAFIRTPQSQEAMDDLLRPAPGPRPASFIIPPTRIDWPAVGAGSLIYALAFVVWLYLAR